VSMCGMILVICGQIIRTTAMVQAGPSFTHLLATDKSVRHDLIMTGLYQYLRHPGYFGWFYWSIGTQLLLCNPFCIVAYFWAAHQFFKHRIPVEEYYLTEIFKETYIDYKKRTWIGIPGIS
jgi:protein-S-isoprenylcysteine O-methyltransferase